MISSNNITKRKVEQKVVILLFFGAVLVSVFAMTGILGVLLYDSIPFFSKIELSSIFAETWSVRNNEFGILALINGTLLIALIAAVVATVLGLGTAIILAEYAPSWFSSIFKPILEVLGGIPTVVYGYFALITITPLLRTVFGSEIVPQFNALSAGIAVGVLITPIVATLSEDAISSVPRSLRYSAYALGATRFEVIRKIVIPAALSGIIAAFVLALSRAIGETMVVTIAAGLKPQLTANPFDTVMTMTAAIVNTAQGETPRGTLGYQSIFAVGLLLFFITLGLNMFGRFLVRKFRLNYE